MSQSGMRWAKVSGAASVTSISGGDATWRPVGFFSEGGALPFLLAPLPPPRPLPAPLPFLPLGPLPPSLPSPPSLPLTLSSTPRPLLPPSLSSVSASLPLAALPLPLPLSAARPLWLLGAARRGLLGAAEGSAAGQGLPVAWLPGEGCRPFLARAGPRRKVFPLSVGHKGSGAHMHMRSAWACARMLMCMSAVT